MNGAGNAGKSTLIEGIATAAGAYGGVILQGALDGKARPASAGLSPNLLFSHTKRIAYASDLKPRLWLHTENTKTISGGDVVSARDMHEKFGRDKRSVSTMFITANYGQEPLLDSTDDGLKRRYRALDYGEKFDRLQDGGKDWRDTLRSQEYADAIITMLALAGRGMTEPPPDIPRRPNGNRKLVHGGNQ